MRILMVVLAMVTSFNCFARECTLEFKEISIKNGCTHKVSDRVLSKELETVEDCFNEAIQLSKKATLARRLQIAKVGGCGADGVYTDIRYSFVEWSFGSFFNFEIPVSGKVNALTNKNVNGFQKGNQVFDVDGYLIH